MSTKIINLKGVLYQHGEGTIEREGFVRPNENKPEEFHEHWEDDLNAARGVFGLPLMVGSVIVGLVVWWGLF